MTLNSSSRPLFSTCHVVMWSCGHVSGVRSVSQLGSVCAIVHFYRRVSLNSGLELDDLLFMAGS
jgi:hypothetical protein